MIKLLPAIFSIIIGADDKVLLIGDSLAHMLAPYMQKTANERHIQFVSVAKGGTTLAQWQEQNWAKAAIKKHNPTILLVSLGTNDLVPINKKLFAVRAEKLTNYAERQGVRVVWLAPPPMPFSVQFVWSSLQGLDVETLMPCARLDREADNIHLTYWANRIWANLIWQYLDTGMIICESYYGF